MVLVTCIACERSTAIKIKGLKESDMKSYKHLWEQFISEDNFKEAYKNAKAGKGYQKQVQVFAEDAEENLKKLRQTVIDGNFHTSKYKEMTIYEPKERIIYKLPFDPDRIVQHAVMNILKPILLNLMIENTFACIEGRGQIKASKKCSEYVRKYKYCLKCDIRKFYPSISHKKLSDMLHRIIKDKEFMKILDDIIYSFPGDYNCPIGNYCSQWFGNFYLSKLDNFVLHTLRCGAYERYCDDFMLFSNDKAFLNECRRRIEEFLNTEMELEYSKADLFDTKQGVDFVGYRHFGKFVLVRKSTVQRMKRRARKLKARIESGEYNKEGALGKLASMNGILKHACTIRLRKKLEVDELTKKVKAQIKHEELEVYWARPNIA